MIVVPPFSGFRGIVARVIGIVAGPDPSQVARRGAAHECSLRGAEMTEFLVREFLQRVGLALLALRRLRESCGRQTLSTRAIAIVTVMQR